MLEKKQLEKYLKLCMASDADFAEVYEQKESSELIKTLNGELEEVNATAVSGVGIRLYKGTTSVYAYSNESTEDALLPLISDLVDSIGRADKNVEVVLTEIKYENNNPVKVDFETVSLDEKAGLLLRATDAAKEADERIVKVQANLLNVKQQVQISNSEGRLIGDTRVRTRIMVSAFALEDGNMQSHAYCIFFRIFSKYAFCDSPRTPFFLSR